MCWRMGMLHKFGLNILQLALPFGDDRSGDGVADDIGGGAAHVQENVDTQNQAYALGGQTKLRQCCGDNDQAGARHGGDTL